MHERGGYPKEEYRRHYDGCKLASKENLGERSGRSPAVRGRVVYELHGANTSLDGLYQIALKTILLLQDIKSEYHLNEAQSLKGISELMDRIYQAEDIFGIRTILMLEITAVITLLHTEDSQYTPVIREILSNIQKNYKEDFSLKVLSYKYHMNTSYLGQIFQKEVGCSFNQYLSNIKNEKQRN